MREQFGKILKEYRLRKDMSLRDLAKMVNVSFSYISKLEKGQYSPSKNVVKELAFALNAPVNEFLAAAGYLPEGSPALPPDAIPIGETKPIPVYGEIRAGLPMLAQNEVIGWVYVPVEHVKGGEYFYLRVKGDSMIGANIIPGALVLVRRQDIIEDGLIGVVMVHGEEATLKRVYYRDGQYILTSENPAYKPQLYDAKDVRIIGEVVKVEFWVNGRK